METEREMAEVGSKRERERGRQTEIVRETRGRK